MISGVLLDLAGVIYDDEKAMPGATDAVDRSREGWPSHPLHGQSGEVRSNHHVAFIEGG
jgi:hypothetical protein